MLDVHTQHDYCIIMHNIIYNDDTLANNKHYNCLVLQFPEQGQAETWDTHLHLYDKKKMELYQISPHSPPN